MTFNAYDVKDESGDLVGFACEFCADPNEESHDIGNTDCPEHCECGRPLECSLTSAGVEYVCEAIEDALDAPESDWFGSPNWDHCDYYKGSPRFAVVNDWAEDLANYSLSDEQQALLDRFRERYAGADTASEHLRAIARLVWLLTRKDSSGNPYRHPEVMDALRLLGKASGVKNTYDVRPGEFMSESERTE